MSSFKVWFWPFRWEIVLLSFGVWRCLSAVDFFLAGLCLCSLASGLGFFPFSIFAYFPGLVFLSLSFRSLFSSAVSSVSCSVPVFSFIDSESPVIFKCAIPIESMLSLCGLGSSFSLSASVSSKLFSLVSVSAGLFSLFVSASASAILPVLSSILPLLLESLSLFRSVSLRLSSLCRIFSAIILALYGVFACYVANYWYCLYLAVECPVLLSAVNSR